MASKLHSYKNAEEFAKTINTTHVVVKLYNFQSKAASVQGMVSMYHATLTEETKRFLRQQFFLPSSDLRCLVATVAYGMVSICNVK